MVRFNKSGGKKLKIKRLVVKKNNNPKNGGAYFIRVGLVLFWSI